jgi:hypothetical protein
MAPEVGLEPTTTRLTAACSTIELLWNPVPRKGRRNLQTDPGGVNPFSGTFHKRSFLADKAEQGKHLHLSRLRTPEHETMWKGFDSGQRKTPTRGVHN